MEFELKQGLFSPDGRLIQVENAQHSTRQGCTMVFHADGDRVIVVHENRQTNPLLLPMPRFFEVDYERRIYIAYSGLRPDATRVTNEAIALCRNYRYSVGEDIRLETLARKIGEYKQQYTVDRSYRPLGLRTVLFGIQDGEAHVYIVETDGNFARYTRCAVGYKSEIAMEYLEKNGGSDCAFKAIMEVVQKDFKKIKGFVLSNGGLEAVPEEKIQEIMSH